MEPFYVSEHLASVRLPYESARVILEAARLGGHKVRAALAQLWLSEGIPYAFAKCPAVYEALRSWLGERLRVHPKEVSMTGSGRLGTALSPRRCGEPFGRQSDLDLFVVSRDLFDRLVKDFRLWSKEYDGGELEAVTEGEKTYWPKNREVLPNNIDRGFIDAKKIPYRYLTAGEVGNAMWALQEKLKRTDNAPQVRDASVRCYADWDDLVSQVSLNLEALARRANSRQGE